MVKHHPKMTALVVSAIRNLREVQGSTPREIWNYINSEYNASNTMNDGTVQRKLCTALKRGLEYGILKEVHGHYSLNSDPEIMNTTEDSLVPMERGGGGCGCKSTKGRSRARARRRASGRKGGGCKSGGRRAKRSSARRRRRGGAGCGTRKRRKSGRKARSRGGGCKSRSPRARRAKSRKGCGEGGGGRRKRARATARRSRKRRGKSCNDRRDDQMEMLVKEPAESNRHRENTGDGGYTYDREQRRSQSRGRQSVPSRSQTPSRSRSSGSSDREGNEGNRRERQTE